MQQSEQTLSQNALNQGWQPAETAPKGDVIIGWFEGYPMAVAATWNEPEQQWVLCNVQVNLYQGKWNDTFFSTEYATTNELKGWMLMPQVA